jgi:hypothetical protein
MTKELEKLVKQREKVELELKVLNDLIVEKGSQRVQLDNKINDLLDKENKNKSQQKVQ